MATFDFGNISGINMLAPGALSSRILNQFGGYDYRHGDFNGPLGRLQILSTSNPGAFILAYGAWAFNPDGTPTDISTVYRIEVWSATGYRLVLDNIGVSFSQLRSALEGKNLAPLYAEHRLDVLGNQWEDTLAGGARDDELYGYGRNDVLQGNDGNDFLDGMTGRDTMTGGSGNDDYAVNHAGDVVREASGGGIDLVLTAVDYTLPEFVEDLRMLSAAGAIDGTGNAHGNFMAGNASANRLRGLDGNDTLIGDGGRDVLLGASGADRLVAGKGADLVLGGNGNDTLHVDSDDLCNGGAGSDTVEFNGTLNLKKIANDRVIDIERFDLRAGAHTLTLGADDVLDMSSTDLITVLGDSLDTVRIAGTQSAGAPAGDGFTRYTIGAATLIIDSDISVV